MMKHNFIIYLILLFIYPTQGGAIDVTSGEHNDFTRVVFIGIENDEWRSLKAPNGVYIQIRETDKEFDFSKIYTKIDKNRIKNYVDYENGTVYLDFGCDCTASVFPVDSAVVVDIAPKSPTTSRQRNIADNNQSDFIKNYFEKKVRNILFVEGARHPKIIGSLAMLRVSKTSGLLSVPAVNMQIRRYKNSIRINLRVKVNNRGDTTLAGLSEERTLFQMWRGFQNKGEFNTGRYSQIRTQTQLQGGMNFQKVRSAKRPTENGEIDPKPIWNGLKGSCEEIEKYNVIAWGGPDPNPNLNRGELLIDREFDSSHRVKEHVKNLIYASFGAEAKLHAGMYLENNNEKMYLLQLASVVDQDFSDFGVFSSADIRCKNRGSLWALLVLGEEAYPSNEEVNVILLSYLELPFHLKETLGARLTDILLHFEYFSAAWIVSNTLAPVKREARTIQDFIYAEASFAQLDFGEAAMHYKAVFKSNSEFSAKALAKFVEARILSGSDLPGNMLTAVQSMIIERSGDPVEEDLSRAEVLILVENRRFEDAMNVALDKHSIENVNPDPRKEEIHFIFERAFDELEDLELSLFLLGPRVKESFRVLRGGYPARVLSRTLYLGRYDLVDEMELFIDETLINDENVALVLDYIEEEGDVDRLFDVLQGTHLNFENIKAQFFVSRGQYENALKFFDISGDSEGALSAAIASENWPWIEKAWREAGDSRFPPALLGNLPSFVESLDLESSENLIKSSQSIRSEILSVLD